jgi:MYXO-CTERM domain-containing protein
MLTSVATEPELGVLVFVAANTRYEARNYENLSVDLEELKADPFNGQNNYYPLISWMIDDAGGRAFVTEFAGTTSETLTNVQNIFLNSDDAQESSAWLQNLLTRRTTLTRMYARMGGWEMTQDPSFQPSAGGAVDRVLDLTGQPEIDVCGPGNDDRIVPCGSTYCGVGAQCATTAEGRDGCVCGEGQTARTINVPSGPGSAVIETVTCQQADFEFLGEVVGTDDGPADPCFANICGENGACVQVNGFATCDCSDGFAAIPNGVGGTTCAEVVDTYDPSQLLWPSGCSGCSTAEAAPAGLFALLFGLAALPRRRRTTSL